MKIDNSPVTIAKVFGVRPLHVRRQLARNAKAIRTFSAEDLQLWGKTKAQAEAVAADYERRAA